MKSLTTIVLVFSLLVGCRTHKALPIVDARSDANIIVAIGATSDEDQTETKYVVGKCPNCVNGKTGDGFEECDVCQGDGQISQHDLERLEVEPEAAEENFGAARPSEPQRTVTAPPPTPIPTIELSQSPSHEPISWLSWSRDALNKIRSANKPVLLHVERTRENCLPCYLMHRDVYSKSEIASYINQNFTPVLVNQDKVPGLAAHWQISIFPVDVLVDPRSLQEVTRYNGALLNAPAYQARLRKIKGRYSDYTAAGNVSSWPHYPTRPSYTWWSGCRDYKHLLQGNHRGKFDRGWLSWCSRPEVQSLHSDDHEGIVKWNYVVRGRR